jgi:hypothetical protein
MTNVIILKIGEISYGLDPSVLPPIGTRISIDPELAHGNNSLAEVTAHEWKLEPPADDPHGHTLNVYVHTKIIEKSKPTLLI